MQCCVTDPDLSITVTDSKIHLTCCACAAELAAAAMLTTLSSGCGLF